MFSQKKGFTIIEVLIATVLFVVVVLMVGSIYIMSQRVNRQGSNITELVQNSRVCMDRLSRDLRQAINIVTVLSSTTPSTEIFFQDGHNPDEISYIKYYLNGSDLMRDKIVYYFSSDPTSYVYYDDVDIFGNPPIEQVLESKVVGEYFSQLLFFASNNIINIYMALSKGSFQLNFNTSVYVRNQD